MYGCVVSAVGTAEHALDLMMETTFDLVVSDIKMPGLSGLDLLRAPRNDSPLLRGKGVQFDPRVVDAFVSIARSRIAEITRYVETGVASVAAGAGRAPGTADFVAGN